MKRIPTYTPRKIQAFPPNFLVRKSTENVLRKIFLPGSGKVCILRGDTGGCFYFPELYGYTA